MTITTPTIQLDQPWKTPEAQKKNEVGHGCTDGCGPYAYSACVNCGKRPDDEPVEKTED